MGFLLGGGGGGLPRSCRAGDDSNGHFTHPRQALHVIEINECGLSLFSNHLSRLREELDGGGEVSGGGTLYMKWGAGLFGPRRERIARAGVKHTLT